MNRDKTKEHIVIFRTPVSVLNITGYNCQELGLAKALTRKGYRVSVVLAGTTRREEVFALPEGDIHVYFLPFVRINQQLGVMFGYRALLSELAPTILQIHDFGIYMSYAAAKWARRHHVPCFLIQGTYEPTRKTGLHQLEVLYNKSFGRRLLGMISGAGYKTEMAARYLALYSQIASKPTYIGLDASYFDAPRDRDWRGELSLDGRKVLLYVGKLEERRNPLFLLEVLEGLPEDYCLILVGDGPQSGQVKDTIRQKHLASRCLMVGRLNQEELPSLYEVSDLFLLASNYEIYGMVILEAMYFGVPVISTSTAGSETIISSGKDGIIIPELNPEKWRLRIRALMDDSAALKDMEHQAGKKIRESLLWDVAVNRFLALYYGNDEK